MLIALIMAGGKGTRFWPLSTEEKPKQFLNLIGNRTMIQMTVDRIKNIIPLEKIFISTVEMYHDLVIEQLPDIPTRNIIIEPEGRNTAPCITLSALVIDRYYKNANMLVLPSDHLINNEENFRNTIIYANNFLDSNTSSIITLGIKPTRPETGYGYIKCSKEKKDFNNMEFVKVDAFVEKPNKEKAVEYLEQGTYLWNAGMFLWNINNILNQIKLYQKQTYDALSNISTIKEENLQRYIDYNYFKTQKTSIDYAILEKSKDIYVIPSFFGWDDVGTWEALDRYKEKDSKGNVLVGRSKAIRGHNNVVISSGQRVVVDGLSDIYVIEKDGNIFIGDKANITNINNLKDML